MPSIRVRDRGIDAGVDEGVPVFFPPFPAPDSLVPAESGAGVEAAAASRCPESCCGCGCFFFCCDAAAAVGGVDIPPPDTTFSSDRCGTGEARAGAAGVAAFVFRVGFFRVVVPPVAPPPLLVALTPLGVLEAADAAAGTIGVWDVEGVLEAAAAVADVDAAAEEGVRAVLTASLVVAAAAAALVG